MSTTLQELVVKFTGDDTQLRGALDRARSAIGTFAKVGAAAGAAAGAAMVALTAKSIEAIGAQKDLAASLGLTYKALEDLALIAGEASVSQESLGQSIGFMQRSLVDAASGAGSAAASLKTLGINAKDLLALSPDEQFNAIATAISSIEDPAARTAIAMDVFGRSGRQIIPMFDDFATAAENARQFNERFGLSLSDLDASRVDEAGDAMGRVGKVFEGVGNTIAVKVSPLITALADEIVDIAPTADTVGKAIVNAMLMGAKGVDELRKVIAVVKQGFLGMAETALHANRGLLLGTQALGFNRDKELAVVEENLRKIRAAAESNIDGFNNMKSAADIMAQSVGKATERANDALARSGGGNRGSVNTSPLLIPSNDDTAAIKRTADAYREVANEGRMMTDTLSSGFQKLADDVLNGENAMQSLRSVALSTLRDIINAVFSVNTGSRGGLGGLLSGIVSSGVNSLVGGIFGGSGATSGSTSAVVPLQPSRMFPSTTTAAAGVSNTPSVIQNITIGSGVQAGVRAEVQRMLPDIQRSTIIAMREADLRGAV